MRHAIYCENGHYVGVVPQESDYMIRRGRVDKQFEEEASRLAFCTKCGKPNLGVCPSCKDRIIVEMKRPSYCGKCGKPYPWTQVALEAAKEYTDELEGLSEGDKTMLKETFDDLTVDSPRTPIAANRFRRILDAAGPVAKDVVVDTLKGALTTLAKDLLGIKG
jgi:hypothetical protein